MQAGQIINGYTNLFTDRYSELSKNRLKVCNSCPFHSGNTSQVFIHQRGFKSKIKGLIMRLRKPYCTVCKCNLKAKTHTPYARCPKGKWGRMLSI